MKDNENDLLRRENARLKEENARQGREIDALRENNENNVDRNNFHLNGVLAESMITAFEVFREIVMFL